MLLLVEPARVEAVSDPKECEPNIWQEPLRGLANRKGQQLDDGRAQGYARLADHEQLVDEGNQDNEAHSDDPCPNGAHGHGRVIMRIDDGPNLSIGAVARKQGDLDLGLTDGTGVLAWLIEMRAVVNKVLEMLKCRRWEVGVGSMGIYQLFGEL